MIYKLTVGVILFLIFSGCQKEVIQEVKAPVPFPAVKKEIPKKEATPIEKKGIEKKILPLISENKEVKEKKKALEEYSLFLKNREKDLEEIEKFLQKKKKEQEKELLKNLQEFSLEDLKKSIESLAQNILFLEKKEQITKQIQKELEKKPSDILNQEEKAKLEKKRSFLQKKAAALKKEAYDLKKIAQEKQEERKKLLQERTNLKDRIKILCPYTLKSFIEEAKRVWENLYPNSKVEIQYSVSYDILDILESEKDVSIAFSFFLKENFAGYESNILAFDSLTILVHSQNPMKTIDIESLASIYVGTKKKWQEVYLGAQNIPIKIYGWQAYSTPFMLLSKIFPEGNSPVAGIQECSNEKEMILKISKSYESIGYVNASFLKKATLKDIKFLKVKNTSMQEASYPLRYSIYCFQKEEDPSAKKFKDFLDSSLGRKIIQEKGLCIPIK